MKKPKNERCRQYFGKFEEAKSFLKGMAPPRYPVRVSRVRLTENAGDCDLIRKRFYIRVDNRLCEDTAILILLHEWSHALSWHDSKRFDHGQAWGKAYSKIWSKWVGER
jgi:hypothetical protein